jgi:lipopolysaccharide transport system ATP-binding protein
MTMRSKTTASPLVFGLMLRDRTGHLIWGTNTWHTRQVIHGVEAGETIVCRLAFKCTLGQGSYSFSPALTNSETHLDVNYEWIDNALVFEVLNMDRPFFIGTNALDGTFEITRSQIA